ncbi:MAG: hypothetical protein H7317_03265 [Pseudorhodobacter sp.]|nr:hypothetical protein [Pseudorhodobacter sp.]
MTVPRLFKFLGRTTERDLARLADTDKTLLAMRDRLKGVMPEPRARGLIEDMLEVALHGAGEHFIGMKGPAIDRILTARGQLAGIFETVMAPGWRGDMGPHLKQLDTIYRDIESGLAELSKPIEKTPPPKALTDTIAARIRREVHDAKSGESPHEFRSAATDALREPGSTTPRLTRRGYRKLPNADTFRRIFKDKSSVELTIKDGRFYAETFDSAGRRTAKFAEFDVALEPYGRTPRTGSLLQAHHGLEGDLMGALFDNYDHNAVPTIWLRNNKTGSPHGIVTALGNMARAGRRDPATLTYEAIRNYAVADMKAAQVPQHAIEAYLAAIDAHVRSQIVPKIPVRDRARMLGGWKP